MTPWLTRQRHRAAFAGCALGIVALTAACTATEDAAAEWPPPVPEVEVGMQEYRFEVRSDGPVPAGRVEFTFENVGAEPHHAMLVPLPEDLPHIDEQLAGEQRRDVSVLASITPRQPGEGGVFAVDLEEGRRYGLVCFVEDDDGALHAHHGMTEEFRAGGPDADPPDQEPAR